MTHRRRREPLPLGPIGRCAARASDRTPLITASKPSSINVSRPSSLEVAPHSPSSSVAVVNVTSPCVTAWW